jgi:cytochrome c556
MNITSSLFQRRTMKSRVWGALAVGVAAPVICALGPTACGQSEPQSASAQSGASAQSQSSPTAAAGNQASKALPPATGFMPTASVEEVMEFVVMPVAQRLWDSVAVNVTEKGIIEKAPKTDEDWADVRGDALTLAEMANALMIPGRATAPPGAKSEYPGDELEPEQIEALREQNWGAWVAHAQVLHQAVMESIKAIDAKDKDALSNAGGTLDEACESCHLEFWYPPKPEEKEEKK